MTDAYRLLSKDIQITILELLYINDQKRIKYLESYMSGLTKTLMDDITNYTFIKCYSCDFWMIYKYGVVCYPDGSDIIYDYKYVYNDDDRRWIDACKSCDRIICNHCMRFVVGKNEYDIHYCRNPKCIQNDAMRPLKHNKTALNE